MPKHTVHLKAPSKDITSVSVDGVEYEGNRGFFQVAPNHAEHLLAGPHFFKRADHSTEDHEDDDKEDGEIIDFAKMSKAELIDFIRDRDGQADRKMSKEQLVELATSLKDKPAAEE